MENNVVYNASGGSGGYSVRRTGNGSFASLAGQMNAELSHGSVRRMAVGRADGSVVQRSANGRFETMPISTIGDNGDSLAHFGIPGMKWGVRRYQNEDGSLTPEGKARYDKPESETWDKKDAKYLSDDELNRRNSRLQRERQYQDLTTSASEREREQLKKDIIKKVVIGTGVSLAAVAMKGHWKQAAAFAGRYSKIGLAKLRTAAATSRGKTVMRNVARYAHASGTAQAAQAAYQPHTFNYHPRALNGGMPRARSWPRI